jgi:rod shape-determining protein MreD
VRVLATLAIAMVVLSLEAAVVRVFGWAQAPIDITVALIVYVGIFAPTVEGAFTAFALGYLLDALSGRPTGLYAFLAVLLFLVVRVANGLIDARTRGLYAMATGAATVAMGLLAAFFTWMTSRAGGQAAGLKGLPWQVLFTFFAALLLWPLLRKVNPGQERPEPGALRS